MLTPHRLAGLALLALAAGCHKPAPVAPAPVRGTVTYQNRPLAGGLVVFTPERGTSKSPKPFAARLDGAGHYELEPAAPLGPGLTAGKSQGVPPGRYQVAFSDGLGVYGFPGELRRPDTSGVTREVEAGRENVLDFDITVGE